MATPKVGLQILTESQEDKELTVNANSYTLDALINGVLAQQTTPPGSPAAGDAYIVSATATGAWAGQENKIAYWFNGGWSFISPAAGLSLFVLGSTATAYFNGSAWVFLPAVSSVGLSAPTGFAVTGSPITTNGTIALAFAAGYSLPTTAKQNQWDAAVNGGVLSLPASAGSLTNNAVYRVRDSGRSLTLSTATDGFSFTTIPDDNKYTWTATASGTAFRDKLSDAITSPATIEGSAVFTYDSTANQWLILQ
ncbi:MAG: DUF2793 domain-containing protein [Prochlorotrichaceae cyanobacterium]